MTTIRPTGTVASTPRLQDTDGHIQFGDVNANGSGRISRDELETALGKFFPNLTDSQTEALARGTFLQAEQAGIHLDPAGWAAIEPSLTREAAGVERQNLINGPSGWLNATGLPGAISPMQAGAMQIPLSPVQMGAAGYMPRNDYAVTGFNPYQYGMRMPPPMMDGTMPGMPGYETPGKQAVMGAGRGIMGFLKMMPVVGNVLNGIDFARDIFKGLGTWMNPQRSFGDKIKASADLLFHGAGMFVPQVGGAYDMAQGAARVGVGMSRMSMNSPFGGLPPFAYGNAGIPNQYAMQYQNPMMNNPYAFNRFPNYQAYPPYVGQNPAFMPGYLGGANMFRQPFPQMPYGMNMSSFGTPQDGLAAAGRTAVGAIKMAPGLGNILNGVDFVRDLTHLFSSNPRHSFLKTAADLLFHGVGMIVPQVGGAYDMAQGAVRMGASALNPMGGMLNPMAMANPLLMSTMGGLPPFAYNPMGYAQSPFGIR